MEAVIVNGRPSYNEFEEFKSIFLTTENGEVAASYSNVADYFSENGWSDFLNGLNTKPEYVELLQSGRVKIIEKFNPETNNYIYIVLDKDIDETDFSSEEVSFAIQITQE